MEKLNAEQNSIYRLLALGQKVKTYVWKEAQARGLSVVGNVASGMQEETLSFDLYALLKFWNSEHKFIY